MELLSYGGGELLLTVSNPPALVALNPGTLQESRTLPLAAAPSLVRLPVQLQ
jgi:hypothetical protein